MPALAVGCRVTATAIVASLAIATAPARSDARSVTEAEVRVVAERFAQRVWGATTESRCEFLQGVEGGPGAYLCDRVTGDGIRATVLLGATTDVPPVLMYFSGRRTDVACADRAHKVAVAALETRDVIRLGGRYFSPMDLWYEFEGNGRRLMISMRDMSAADPRSVRAASPVRRSQAQATVAREQWADYSGGEFPGGLDGKCWLPAVPDWDYHFGCAPTAAANVLSFWDRAGYDRLVDSVLSNVPDRLEGDLDSVPDVSWQLAVAMGTDTLTSGTTSIAGIPAAIAAVCSDPVWGNDYQFTSYIAWNDRDLLIREIDSGRPGVLVLVGHPEYGAHAVAWCGWGPPDQNWVMVHDVWGGTPCDVVLNVEFGGQYAVIPVIPKTASNRDVELAAIARPCSSCAAGVLVPQVSVVNRSSASVPATAWFQVERQGGGIDESFEETMSFPPDGWGCASEDGSKSTWELGSCEPGKATRCASCPREPSGAGNDDWLIAPAVQVNAGDTLSFCFRARGPEAQGPGAESLEVRASGSGEGPGSFDHVVWARRFQNREFESALVALSLPGETPARLAFRYVMEPGAPGMGVEIDEVRLATVYFSDRVECVLGPGQSRLIEFGNWHARDGRYVARCSTYSSGDSRPEDNVLTLGFRVSTDDVGRCSPWAGSEPDRVHLWPNPAGRTVRTVGRGGPALASIYDASGRLVHEGRLGVEGWLELPRLPAGAYVVRFDGPSSPASIGRLVVAR